MQESINDKERHIQDLIRELKNSHENNETLVMQKIHLEMEIQEEVINKLQILSREEDNLLKLEAEVNKINNDFIKNIRQLQREKDKLKNDNNKINVGYKDLQLENEQILKVCQKIEFERERSINNHIGFKEEKEKQLLEIQKKKNAYQKLLKIMKVSLKKLLKKRKKKEKVC